jgi:hypothetical protein
MQLHSKAWSQRPFMHPGRGTQTSQWGPSLKKLKRFDYSSSLKPFIGAFHTHDTFIDDVD